MRRRKTVEGKGCWDLVVGKMMGRRNVEDRMVVRLVAGFGFGDWGLGFELKGEKIDGRVCVCVLLCGCWCRVRLWGWRV
ncbi:hypothetical protein Hanom_Chr03g00245841 [Helianthus anomalus]